MFNTLRRHPTILTAICCSLSPAFYPATVSSVELTTIEWHTEGCDCKAKIKPGTLSRETVLHLSTAFYAFEANQTLNFWDYRNATTDELTPERARFQQEATEKTQHLSALQLPAGRFVEELRLIALRNHKLANHLYLAELDFLITGDTAPLKGSFLGEKLPPECEKFADVMKSKNATYQFLPDFAARKCADNVDPDWCKENILKKTLTDFKNAQLELLSSGWHNCALDSMDLENPHEYTHQALAEIDPLLIDKECVCDDQG